MTAYLISDVGAVAPEDEEAWKAYLAVAPATIQKYGGRYLARGGAIDVIEGDWSPYAIVIAEFPDREAVKRWYASPEYAEGLKNSRPLTLASQDDLRRRRNGREPDKLLAAGSRPQSEK